MVELYRNSLCNERNETNTDEWGNGKWQPYDTVWRGTALLPLHSHCLFARRNDPRTGLYLHIL